MPLHNKDLILSHAQSNKNRKKYAFASLRLGKQRPYLFSVS